jgi:hypothetical protein
VGDRCGGGVASVVPALERRDQHGPLAHRSVRPPQMRHHFTVSAPPPSPTGVLRSPP